MPRLPIDAEALDALHEVIEPPPPPPKKPRKTSDDGGWSPMLGPEQQEIFDSPAKFILADGEKGSGKTHSLGHKLVRHAYENANALCLIGVRVRSMATKGGVWDKLVNQILPTWRDGNRDPDGNLLDDGMGLEYTDVKYDSQHNEYLWIGNRHGGWSLVVLISCPHATQLRDRMRGFEPSFVLWDELTSCDSREYLNAVAIQVGRRPGIEGPQQYTAACNPDSPKHWVHQVWMVEAYDEKADRWDPDYHRVHVPVSSNRHNLPKGYIEGLEKLYKHDPVEAARMLRGEWVDRPSGTSIFKDVWIAMRYVKPALDSPEWILPTVGYPIIIGMDPGAVYNAFVMLQRLPIEQRMKWVAFDEVVINRRRIKYEVLMPVVLRRLAWWQQQVGGRFQNVWISDNSAFNQFKAGSGSFDVTELEAAGNAVVDALSLPRIEVRPAPKFAGSVPLRTRLLMDAISAGDFWVSAGCTKIQAMLNLLESKEQKPGEAFDPDLALTPVRSDHLHVFDALTYPIITNAMMPHLLAPIEEGTQELIRIRG
jgi:hypothetical protein